MTTKSIGKKRVRAWAVNPKPGAYACYPTEIQAKTEWPKEVVFEVEIRLVGKEKPQ